MTVYSQAVMGLEGQIKQSSNSKTMIMHCAPETDPGPQHRHTHTDTYTQSMTHTDTQTHRHTDTHRAFLTEEKAASLVPGSSRGVGVGASLGGDLHEL